MKRISFIFFGLIFSGWLSAQVGNPAPDFSVTDTHGEMHTLYDYLDDGKFVVLDFFFTTCIPCQFYSPQVNLAFEKYGCNMADVIFMGIDVGDTDAEVIAYDTEYEIEYPSISGLDGGGNAVADQYGILGFPTFYVIGPNKTIVEVIDPPTLQVFDFRFAELGIEEADCSVTGLVETRVESNFGVFPNPVGGQLVLQLPQMEGQAGYEILDRAGQRLAEGELSGANIDVDFLLPGLYLLRVVNGQDVYTTVFYKK